MSMTEVATQAPRPAPIVDVRQKLDAMSDQFKFALPAHIPVERFMRVVMTAIQGNPYLLDADRRSLLGAAMKAAQDGLLPDGREGALVPYKNDVTWIPMIAGLRKKVRNSGEIATWDVVAVYTNDKFEFELGDNPFIRHAPTLKDQGALIAVYSIATLKSGEKSRDVMGVAAVERIRDRSSAWKLYKAGKIKSTPWQTDFDEMAKKTVARRHAKVLPMSTDLDDLIRRDDALYDFDTAKEEAKAGSRPTTLADRLDALAGPSEPAHDPDTGEVMQDNSETDAGSDDTASQAAGVSDGERDSAADSPAADHGAQAADDRTEEEKLFDEAREHATEGKRVLDRWYNGLNADNLDRINPHMPTLWKATKAVDEATKKAAAEASKPASDASDSEKSRLLADAEAAADKGRRAYDAFWNSLEPFERGDLKEHSAALMARANKADGRA